MSVADCLAQPIRALPSYDAAVLPPPPPPPPPPQVLSPLPPTCTRPRGGHWEPTNCAYGTAKRGSGAEGNQGEQGSGHRVRTTPKGLDQLLPMIEMGKQNGWIMTAQEPKWTRRAPLPTAAWHGVSRRPASSCRSQCLTTPNSDPLLCSRRATMASGLDDLLSGLPGFSKPSMKELKQQGRGTGSTPLQANAAASRSPATTGTGASPPRPPQAPGPAPAAVPFALDQLDHLVKSQSSPALAAQRCACPPAACLPPRALKRLASGMDMQSAIPVLMYLCDI